LPRCNKCHATEPQYMWECSGINLLIMVTQDPRPTLGIYFPLSKTISPARTTDRKLTLVSGVTFPCSSVIYAVFSACRSSRNLTNLTEMIDHTLGSTSTISKKYAGNEWLTLSESLVRWRLLLHSTWFETQLLLRRRLRQAPPV
jgi:hypothetical protein